ncbi:MAG: transcription termination/antitermination protein NusG [Candidatus Carbobacillus sp.]|nr:transcription termination/antitermination protein NusG [Candidatus Carbobacillus sp.]
MSEEARWYVVHTYSGYEKKVEANLKKRVESMGMADKIFRIIVPMEEMREIKNGKAKMVQKKVFPGYVLVEMIMTDDSWYVVRNTPGVTGFVGSTGAGSKPTPLLPEEVDRILRTMGLKDAAAHIRVSIGAAVRVLEGPFQDMHGKVEAIDKERGKVIVTIDLFGRETPVELEAYQIEEV